MLLKQIKVIDSVSFVPSTINVCDNGIYIENYETKDHKEIQTGIRIERFVNQVALGIESQNYDIQGEILYNTYLVKKFLEDNGLKVQMFYNTSEKVGDIFYTVKSRVFNNGYSTLLNITTTIFLYQVISFMYYDQIGLKQIGYKIRYAESL